MTLTGVFNKFLIDLCKMQFDNFILSYPSIRYVPERFHTLPLDVVPVTWSCPDWPVVGILAKFMEHPQTQIFT